MDSKDIIRSIYSIKNLDVYELSPNCRIGWDISVVTD